MPRADRVEGRPDHLIQMEVLAELDWDPRVESNEIGVIAKDGIVTLTGWVTSLVMRWAAEEAAHRVSGVRALANEIEVRLPSSSERNDIDIAAAAANALESNVSLTPGAIEVTVSGGWITLKGTVEWHFQRFDAEREVHSLWGVKGVSNQITIRARPVVAELKKEIAKAIQRRNSDTEVDVEAYGNTVVLRGRARTWAERLEAERVAWAANGVTAVDNKITVVS